MINSLYDEKVTIRDVYFVLEDFQDMYFQRISAYKKEIEDINEKLKQSIFYTLEGKDRLRKDKEIIEAKWELLSDIFHGSPLIGHNGLLDYVIERFTKK